MTRWRLADRLGAGVWAALLLLGVMAFARGSLPTIGAAHAVNMLYELFLLLTLGMVAAGAGRWLWHRAGPRGRPGADVLLHQLVVGLLLVSNAMALLGFAHVLFPVVIAALAVVVLACVWPDTISWLRDARAWVASVPLASWRRDMRWGIVGVAVAILAALCVIALAPPTIFDDLAYHIMGPVTFLRDHAITPLPLNANANFPMTSEMLNTFFLALGTYEGATLPSVLLWVLVVLATVALAATLGRPGAPWLAAILVVLTPAVLNVVGSGYVELMLALLSLCAILAFQRWLVARDERWIVLCGIYGGAALASKYTAISVAGILGCVLLGQALLEGQGSTRTRARTMVTRGLLYAAPLLALPLPWLLKNWVGLGDPFYPYLLFARQYPGLTYLMTHFGRGTSLRDTLTAPLDLFTTPTPFAGSAFTQPNPLLGLAPLSLLANWRSRRVAVLIVFACVLAGYLEWVHTSQQVRLLMPIYPLAAVLAADTLAALGGIVASSVRTVPRPALVALALLAAAWPMIGIGRPLEAELKAAGLNAVGVVSRSAYLSMRLGVEQDAVACLNKQPRSANTRVLMFNDARVLYLDMPAIPDQQWITEFEYIGPSTRATLALLGRDHVAYVWFYHEQPGGYQWRAPGAHLLAKVAVRDQLMRDTLRPICSFGPITVYANPSVEQTQGFATRRAAAPRGDRAWRGRAAPA